jgi:hypothetical protein
MSALFTFFLARRYELFLPPTGFPKVFEAAWFPSPILAVQAWSEGRPASLPAGRQENQLCFLCYFLCTSNESKSSQEVSLFPNISQPKFVLPML